MKRLWLAVALVGLLCVSSARAVVASGVDRVINAGKEGQAFDYRPFLIPGKINIVDFYSKYCPPCRKVMPALQKLSEQDPRIVVLRVDINRPGVQYIDFDSAVAHQYRLMGIPAFKVFNPHGKLIAEGEQGTDLVLRMLEKANIHL